MGIMNSLAKMFASHAYQAGQKDEKRKRGAACRAAYRKGKHRGSKKGYGAARQKYRLW